MIAIPKANIPESVASVLSQIALPLESLQTESPGRTTEIETVGFPMGVGVEAVSSIVVTGSLASDELLAKTNWGQEPVLYAAPTVGSGTSGGPVFMAHEDSKQVELVGMYIGFLSDESGSKLSKLVPSRVIREFVSSSSSSSE